MKRKKSDYIVIILVVVLFAWTVQQSCENAKESRLSERYLQDEIELLQNKNDSLLNDAIEKEQKIDKFKDETDSLLTEADTKKKNFEIIYIARDEKIRTIDNMDGNELYEFFAGFNTGSTSN